MELTRFDDAAAFYQRAESFLLAHEAENNLMLGICSSLMHSNEYEQPPYLAVVTEGDEVVAAAIRTPPHLVILAYTADERIAFLAGQQFMHNLRNVYGDQLPGVNGPSAQSKQFAQMWQVGTGQAYHLSINERIYQVDTVVPVAGVPGGMRRATEADRAVLTAWTAGFFDDAGPLPGPPPDIEAVVDRVFNSPVRGMYLWEVDGQPVTMVGFTGPTPNGMRIGPVYTPPELRRKGYASACTAAASQALLDEGRRFCFLYTNLANPTANHIYQQIGYRPVCDVDVYSFVDIP
ncbi:MAG: hypothetical protein OJF49_001685 [Ktedonobacterales bacterium]|jgi:predicted GNAT family acetyltransferase|nr:MAG: hypothetical protein OJF49_001685 [Ktedonobacterales bacterium]